MKDNPLKELTVTSRFLRDKIAECKKQPNKVPDTHFVCYRCLHVLPICEIGYRMGYRKTVRECKSCFKKINRGTKRNLRKINLDKLPKWMYDYQSNTVEVNRGYF